jgi:hypothetical protein
MSQAKRNEQHAPKRRGLSLHPLSLDEALAGAMQTGKPPEPEPQNKNAKRTATKRRGIKKQTDQG